MRLPRRLQRFLILFFVGILLWRLYRRAASKPTAIRIPKPGSSSPAPDPIPTVPANLERIFIAVNLHNVAHSFSDWSKSVLDLINLLGSRNVYLSIHEAGSNDGTKGLLELFEGELKKRGIQNRVTTDDAILEELKQSPKKYREGWTFTQRKKWELRKIPWQAKLRNRVLEPLDDKEVFDEERKAEGLGFGYVLFLGGGVYFSVSAISPMGWEYCFNGGFKGVGPMGCLKLGAKLLITAYRYPTLALHQLWFLRSCLWP